MKRAVDLLSSLVGLAVLWPVLAIIGMIVFLTSGKPVFFYQVRVGLFGRPFLLMKFRTMSHRRGAESGIFEPGSRARVTPFGKVLRATKLDEFPQLWNVVKGDMSLVGPRPEIGKWVDAYPDRWRKVLSIRPGITDPASLIYRDEETVLSGFADPEKAYREIVLPHKLDIYEEYVDNRTLIRDLGLVLETLRKIIQR
jgi:lipopolysaccharide/colanic/teichoic acid biosynthesis glycosyltransferase